MNSQNTPNTIASIKSVSKVSVIVPVYNTELYVERALVSLLGQTLDDVQFIIIDDGSKDNSLAIIQQVITRYPERQAQVTLISRENRGVAATRGQGMALATGDYITHLDSDDWAELNWLEVMYTKAIAENADVVVCDYYEVYNDKFVAKSQDVSSSGVGCISGLLKGDICNTNWNKLVRRKIFESNAIVFTNNIKMGEDFLVTLDVFIHADKVFHIKDKLYNYNRTNDNSLTILFDGKSLADLLVIAERMDWLLLNNQCYDDQSIVQAAEVFKLNIRNMYVLKSVGNHDYKRLAINLYPETNDLIGGELANRSLKLVCFLHKKRLDYLFFIVDALMVFNRFLRGFKLHS